MNRCHVRDHDFIRANTEEQLSKHYHVMIPKVGAIRNADPLARCIYTSTTVRSLRDNVVRPCHRT